MKKFKDLGLSEETLDILKKQKIVEPTEIQSKTIPLVLEGRDVVATSSTGSGKTLAFASAIIEKIVPEKSIQSIILTPTRELAEQVKSAINLFAGKRLNVLAVYGGVSIEKQMRGIEKADVVVGTPGRVLDHLSRRSLNLKNIKVLVLDEFDRMLDMGFHRDVEKIIAQTPKERQTLLFSATTSGVEKLIKKYTNNHIEISAKAYVDHSKLKQVYYNAPSNKKFPLLVHLLEKEKNNSDLIIVFCSTRRNVDFVTENLILNGIKAKAIHGGMEQKKRIKVLQEFHKKGIGILVCTDVAARGLDIEGVSHVYNYDLPQLIDDYVHRIGRTARAGGKGIAINILSPRDYEIFSDITKKKDFKIEELELPYTKDVEMNKDAGKNSRRGRKPNRGSSRDRKQKTENGRQGIENRGSRRGKVELYDAVCKKCGKKCKVPFKPTTGVGVSCSECFVPRSEGGNYRGKSTNKGSSRGRDSRRTPSRGRDSGKAPPRGRDSGRAPSRGRDSGRAPSRGRDSGRAPSRRIDSGRAPSRRIDSGRAQSRGRDSGRSAPRGRDSGRGDRGQRTGNRRESNRGDRERNSRRNTIKRR